MTGKFANKSGPIAPSIAGYPENRRIPGVFFASRRNRCRQVADSHQIVRRGGEGEHSAHPAVLASVPSLPEIPHGFHPAEDFLHPFSQALTDGIPRMAGGAAVNGGLPALAVLGHMGHGLQAPHGLDPRVS
jgi:hypothetical protein